MSRRTRSASAISENSIVFFQGGHNHDGISSSLINTDQYSIYDFIVGKTGSNERQIKQQRNFDNLKTVISNIVINDVLGPSGVRLLPNSVQSVHIAAGAITANELAANIVLVNNVISSNNYVPNTSGWVLYSNGTAEFGAASIRGALVAAEVSIDALNFWEPGWFRVGFDSNNFMEFYNNNLTVAGEIRAVSGQVGDLTINPSYLHQGGTFAGTMDIGNLDDAAAGTGYDFIDAQGNDLAGVWIIGAQAGAPGNNLLLSSERIELWDDGMTATGYTLGIWKQGIEYSTNSDRIEFYYDPAPGVNGELYAYIHHSNGIITTYCIASCGSTSEPDPVSPPVGVSPVPVGVSSEPPAPCTPCGTECCTPTQTCAEIKGTLGCIGV